VEVTPQNGISYWISAMSTVLALRGNHVTVQPFVNPSNGSILCWNGEAWKIGSNSIEGNDGQLLFDLLMRASSTQKCAAESIVAILNILQTISGPFAFVFVDKIHSQIYFGRDCLGRRSLLYKIDGDSHTLHLSSVADPTSGPWLEVEADAIYQLSCDGGVGWEPGSSTDGLLSTPFASISKHLWDNPTSGSSVRSPFLLSNLSDS
jgi:asparagine synthetase B (glutamine-hydrolysing)